MVTNILWFHVFLGTKIQKHKKPVNPLSRRRLLLLFAVLLGTVGAWAQDSNVPFKTSTPPSQTAWDANTTWYFIQFPNSDDYHTGGYIAGEGSGFVSATGYDGDGDNKKTKGKLLITQTTKPLKHSALWCIVGDEESGYMFYNRLNPNLILGMTDSEAKLYTSKVDGVTYSFAYAASTNNKAGLENCATFRFKGTNKYLNNQDAGGSNPDYLKVWGHDNAISDNGSAIRLIEATDAELEEMAFELPAISTEDNYTYFTIKNYRSGKYAKYAGDATQMTQVNSIENAAMWYLIKDAEGNLKLGNKATSKLFASKESFTDAGSTIYIKENPYFADFISISTKEDLSGKCWDDANGKIGDWNPRRTDFEGTSWIIEPVSESGLVASAKEDYTNWVNALVIGSQIGQYSVDEDKLAEATTELETATTLDATLAAIEKAMSAYSMNMLEVGKYYRIRSTTHSTYTGLDGYTLKMKNVEGNEQDPTQIWKYEQLDGNYYMKNVYAGLYPQEVTASQDKNKSVLIGTSKQYKFTYAQHASAVKDGADAKWNIFFGGNQVNIESNGSVNNWWGDNSHHYIYEVDATDDELATMCIDWYNANKYIAPEPTASTYKKIDIDENATVIISPNEFAAPSEINEAIDKLAAVEGNLKVTVNNASDIHTLFAALSEYEPAKSTLAAYKNNVETYGELLSIAYTPKAEWGTIILPINWAKPEGWTRYSCAATEGNVLTLTEYNADAIKNAPMVIQVTEDKIGTTYQLIGYSNGAGTENVEAGLLTGVLEDNCKVPAGSYVLAKYNGVIGFYPVAEGAEYDAAKYKCYLTLPEASARYNALFFEGTETAIESVQSIESTTNTVVYDLAGRRVQNAQKGVFIVNGKVVIK